MNKQYFQAASAEAVSCSKSCSRAGLFAIGLSFLAFALIPALDKIDELKEYSNYVNLRFRLTEIIEELEHNKKFDQCWRNLFSKDHGFQDIMQWDLFKLQKIRCGPQGKITILGPSRKKEGSSSAQKKKALITSLPLKSKSSQNNPKIKKPDTTAPSAPTALEVPTGLSITTRETSLKGLEDLEENLRSLNDRKILNQARNLSLKTMSQITYWARERREMFTANYFLEEDTKMKMAKVREIRKSKKLSKDDEDIFIFFLTLENIMTLQKSYFPTLEDFEKEIKPYSLFKIPLAQVEVNFNLATTLILFGLFICTSYFLIFLREGRNLPETSATGTLISALKRDWISFSLFIIFALIPIIASQLLAFYSTHGSINFSLLFNWVFALLTALFSIWTVWELRIQKLGNHSPR